MPFRSRLVRCDSGAAACSRAIAGRYSPSLQRSAEAEQRWRSQPLRRLPSPRVKDHAGAKTVRPAIARAGRRNEALAIRGRSTVRCQVFRGRRSLTPRTSYRCLGRRRGDDPGTVEATPTPVLGVTRAAQTCRRRTRLHPSTRVSAPGGHLRMDIVRRVREASSR
jgi:hypothetical protein